MLPHTVKQRSLRTDPRGADLHSSPWDWGSAVSCIGPRSPAGLGGRMGQLPMWWKPAVVREVLCTHEPKYWREPRNKPGTGPYGGTASNLHWGSVLTQNIFLLMFWWHERTQLTWASHTGNSPSTSSLAATANMWGERNRDGVASLFLDDLFSNLRGWGKSGLGGAGLSLPMNCDSKSLCKK